MNKYLKKLLYVIKSGLAAAALTIPLAHVSVVGFVSAVSVLPSIAHAQKERKLCYMKFKDGTYKYFERNTSTWQGSKCGDSSIVLNGSLYFGKNVPRIRGVDMSKCENFAKWKFGRYDDICNAMLTGALYNIAQLKVRFSNLLKKEGKKGL